MTITSIKRIKDGSGGNVQGPHDTSIAIAYRVETDNPFDTPAEIRLALPLKWGDFLPGTGLMCQGEDYDFVHKGPGQAIWEVTLDFSSIPISQEEQEREEKPNPLDRRARIVVRSVRYGMLRNTDINGDVKRTSAGEIYEAKEVDVARWVIQVRKNYATIPDFCWSYQNKLNDAPVTVKGRILQTESVKFGEIVIPELQIENGYEYYPIEFDLDYREPPPDGVPWKDKRVDAGFYYLDGSDLKRILDADDEPVVVEEWLDGSGGRLRDTISNPAPGDETINDFDDYETADFSVLPLNEV